MALSIERSSSVRKPGKTKMKGTGGTTVGFELRYFAGRLRSSSKTGNKACGFGSIVLFFSSLLMTCSTIYSRETSNRVFNSCLVAEPIS